MIRVVKRVFQLFLPIILFCVDLIFFVPPRSAPTYVLLKAGHSDANAN